MFAPKAGSQGEDDGYLITFVCDEASGESEAWIIDAKNVAGPPLARIAIPQRVPTGYHAWWIGADDLAAQRPSPLSA